MAMRGEFLRIYRRLHRTCWNVFKGDHETLRAARRRLRDEFWKNRQVTDPEQLSKLLEEAKSAEKFLREHVVQAVKTGEENVFRVNIRKDTLLEDNALLPRSERTNNR